MSKPKLPKEVRDLTAACKNHLAWMDHHMKQPSTVERGKLIAEACNRLDMAVQIIERFGIKERRPRTTKEKP
ncbi:MAG TPA: hypothetical protein VMQ76_11415 [Terracidiphilus sp.]|nr:hypothetical protein [Terracidiphilus sp.]